MFETVEEFLEFVNKYDLSYEIQKQEDEYGHWCEYDYVSIEDAWGDDRYKIVIVVQD